MQDVRFVVVGHIDHGKSTLLGRLLADTRSIPESKVEHAKNMCKEKGKDFEYAYLLDAFEEEQEQNITIDITKIEFDANGKHYVIIDAPGHKEFLKNMISGAASADAALLLVDAKEGIKEQTKRHAYMLHLLGIQQVIVVVNKMDLVEYKENQFNEVANDVTTYLKELDITPKTIIPVSARDGDNIATTSKNMPWYTGEAVIKEIATFEANTNEEHQALRLPIQDVYKFDDRRILVGRIEAGTIKEGDEILIQPGKHKTKVKTLEYWQDKDRKNCGTAGDNIGITVEDEAHFYRGQIITPLHAPANMRNLLTSNVFWMGTEPLTTGKIYKIKLATQEVEATVQTIHDIVNTNTLTHEHGTIQLEKNTVGTVVFKTKTPLVFDSFTTIPTLGRFVIVDDYNIAGGGIITKLSEELRSRTHIQAKSQHIIPKEGLVNREDRAKQNNHKGKVIWITGLHGSGKEEIAQQLEKTLFEQGKHVYYLDASNVRLSLSSDLTFTKEEKHEQARRLAEVANILLDAGMIVIVSVVSPYAEDRAHAKDIIGEENYLEVYVKTPLEICKQNDPQGIYTRAEKGELTNVPGIDLAYEQSTYPVCELTIKENNFDIESYMQTIQQEVEK